MKYVMSKFSIKNLITYLKDMLGMSRLIGFINKESGRQSIYGYLLDTKSAQSRRGVLCIDDEKYDIECNIYHKNIEKNLDMEIMDTSYISHIDIKMEMNM